MERLLTGREYETELFWQVDQTCAGITKTVRTFSVDEEPEMGAEAGAYTRPLFGSMQALSMR